MKKILALMLALSISLQFSAFPAQASDSGEEMSEEMTEEMTEEQSSEGDETVKTAAEKDLQITNCPNCGAPTQVTSSGECEYCHSVITNGDFGWVLNQYMAW